MSLNKIFFNFRKIDWVLVACFIFLSFFGLAAIYSVALGQGHGALINFQKQSIWLIISAIAMVFLANLDYHYWRKWCWIGYLLSLVLLVVVLTPLGATINGTRGWINLHFFVFQPVEITKFFLIFCLADVYSRQARTIHKFGQMVLIGLVVLLPFLLVSLQPDFGSAMVMFFLWFFSFILVSKNKWHAIVILSAIVIAFLACWFFIFQSYQKDRVMIFLNPNLDPKGRGYNVHQSVIAVGGGELFGMGLGFGSQSQLKFIPESQTDFIFAVLAEELGFVGVAFILGLFALMFYRLYGTAARSPDDFGMFIALLSIILIFIHTFINIGMGIGLLPVTGIPLPYISYGGSFLLISYFLAGVNLNIKKSAIFSRK